ncbi:hypothetical protein GCM10007967_23890 [Xylanimonas ulmi]
MADCDRAEMLRSISTLAELAYEWFPRCRTQVALTGDGRRVRAASQPPALRERLEALGSHADISLDLVSRTARASGREVELTDREAALLAYLARVEDRVVSRSELLDTVWSDGAAPVGVNRTETRTVDVHVHRVRRKLGLADLILTVWGTGYRLNPDYQVRLVS